MSGWLVTGANGMLGRDLMLCLQREGENADGYGHRDFDITDTAAIRDMLGRRRPTTVVNCAAWTGVDEAETHEDAALTTNGHAVAQLASTCSDYGITLVQMSTDYVFEGTSSRPYGETDRPSPRTAYGRSKLAGERAVLKLIAGSSQPSYVVRTAWLYGAHGRNFVQTMIRLARERPTVDVVDDQHGQPSWTVDVAGRIIALVRSGAAGGIYHATSAGQTTWFGLAQEVFRLLGTDPGRVRPTSSSAYPRAASRPPYSVLGHDAWTKVGLEPIGNWRHALRRAFPQLLMAPRADEPVG